MKVVLFWCVILFTASLHAQRFSNDKEKFVKELTKSFPSESFQRFLKKDFSPFLMKSGLSSMEFEQLTQRCNYLFDENFAAADIIALVHVAMDQKESLFPSSFVSDWHSLFDSKKNENDENVLHEFIAFSLNFFGDFSFYAAGNHKWVYQGSTPRWVIHKSGPQIHISNTNLKCFVIESGPVDSIVVQNTSGYYDLRKKKWYGRGGIITWEKVNFHKDSTYAEIRGYNLNARESILKVDTVALTTPYFEEPILGRLKDKTLFNLKLGESSPIFNSFEKRLKIEGLRDQLDYNGGFSLQGAEFIGKGDPDNLAKVVIHYNDRELFEVRALKFLMNPEQIIAREADFSMHYTSGDSLYAKNTLFYWNEANQELRITANKKGSNLLPFNDSYFKLFIKAPLLSWTLNSAYPMFTYEVGTAQEQKYAFIESWDYFDQRAFQRFAGVGNINPLIEIADLSIKHETNILPVGKVASALGKSVSQFKSQLIDIASSGFIRYTSSSDEVYTEQKLLNYVLASRGEKDYDELSFICDLRPKVLKASPSQITNDPYLKNLEREFQKISARRNNQLCFAHIDLDLQTIHLNEVERVSLSSKQRTSFYPDSAYVKIYGDRNMKVSGWIQSGKLWAHSINSSFDYDSFSITIDSADEAYLRVNPLNSRDGNDPIDMISSFSGFQGTLYIDDSTMKSGRNSYNSNFPYLEVQKNLRILYSSEDIVNGAYDSARFYYVVDPFVLDSLDDFNERELRLEGHLVSDGIFPILKEPIRIMNDYSFGFFTEAPSEGYPFYETASLYQNRIVLSNNGLQGAGTINFLQASVTSKKLTFLPDSTVGLANFFNKEIVNGVEYPEATCELAKMTFKPRLKILSIQSYSDSFIELFKGECALDGSISISETGMVGSGRIDLMDALLVSDSYSFKSSDIFSDSASFTLRNRFAKYGENPMAIQSDGLKSHVSFKDRLGIFNSSGSKRIKFPSNKFYCQMDKFIWQMDGESIDFERNQGKETNFESSAGIVANNFFSLDPAQDSLQFKSISAQYDLKNETINCFKVDFLELGDAYVYPKGRRVNVLKNAVIDTFENARIVANRITKLHEFTDVTLTVLGRNEFDGIGNYLYYDRDSVSTKLAVSSISFDRIQTVAKAVIPENMHFQFSNKFAYYGSMDIASKNKGIICEGYTRLVHGCSFDKSWMYFEDTIIAENVTIPVTDDLKNIEGDDLAVGFLWRDAPNVDSIQIYPTFLSSKDFISDSYLFNASGKVFYDYENGRFEISDEFKKTINPYQSNSITLKDGSCLISGTGKIDLGIDLDPVNITSYGSIAYDVNKEKTIIQATAKINIPIQKTIVSKLANQIVLSDSLSEYTFDRQTQDELTDVFSILGDGRDKGEKIFKEYDEDKLRKVPSFMNATFLIPDLRLESYSLPKNADGDAISGLRSRNSKLVLFSVGDLAILKKVPGQILFMQKTSPDVPSGFELILEDRLMKRQNWMKYERAKRNGILNIFTSDSELLKELESIKPDKRKSKNFGFAIFEEGDMFQIMSLKR